ncbi:MAG TPA: ATP-binding protein [Burkholderiales bacterium]
MNTSEKANILLVDDQPSRLLTYEAILEPLQENLVKVRSGAAALQCLMEMEFAAMLLDVSMPGMNGFEIAELIHKHPRFQDLPIIFVTGVHVTDFDKLRGYAMGAVDYVQVPVVPEILRSKLRVLVQLYRSRAELRRLNERLAAANAELAAAHNNLRAEKTRELERANAALGKEIEERERAQRALQEAAERKDRFLAILAHELRNPLSAIYNGVQVLRAEAGRSPRTLRIHELLDRQVGHLTRLIEDLLDVSRLTSGRIRLKKEPVDLAAIVGRALDTARPLIEARKHRLTLDLTPEPVYVDGDPVRLVQMLDNLLSNAAKYTDEGGAISVSLAVERNGAGEQAVIRVRDNGSGIPPHLLDRVFDLFARADTPGNHSRGGLGIGLSLVRGVAELHGGTVAAQSEGPGCGSEFTVRLPCCPPPRPAETPADAPRAQHESALRILVVDDNADSAVGLTMCLEDRGHEVHVAHSGEAGIETALRHVPDVGAARHRAPRHRRIRGGPAPSRPSRDAGYPSRRHDGLRWAAAPRPRDYGRLRPLPRETPRSQVALRAIGGARGEQGSRPRARERARAGRVARRDADDLSGPAAPPGSPSRGRHDGAGDPRRHSSLHSHQHPLGTPHRRLAAAARRSRRPVGRAAPRTAPLRQRPDRGCRAARSARDGCARGGRAVPGDVPLRAAHRRAAVPRRQARRGLCPPPRRSNESDPFRAQQEGTAVRGRLHLENQGWLASSTLSAP